MKTWFTRLKRIVGCAILYLAGKNEPTAIIMVDGGFCSVLDKYLVGRFLQVKRGTTVRYDLSWYQNSGIDCDGKDARKFQLSEVFPNLDFPVSSPAQTRFFKCFFCQKNKTPFVYDQSLGLEKYTYLDGYFMHWKYFDQIEDIICKELNISSIQIDDKNKAMLSDIKSRETSVAIHIRRGDYVKMGWCILTPEYYLAAIHYMIGQMKNQDVHLYIFSNGIEWSKEHILDRLPSSVTYTLVDINDNDHGYFDLRLIAECDHQISSNSSFGFWGGLLNRNPNKTVIIPEKWLPEPHSSGNQVALLNSEFAHRVPGWTIFSIESLQPITNDLNS